MFWVVLDENVIRRRVGGAAVMGEQLSHVAALAERRRIGLQVLPFDVGVPPVSGMLSLMTFEDAPPVAYSEGTRSGEVMDDPEWVTGLEQSYGYVRAAAFSPERSLALVQQVAKECVNGQ
ncbi:hypothetical protein GCM10020221_06820 [Streptomyces thioluteus]|uniref:DUF5753 domain-containing protein n=1 Tax=Streptomyces thioluteus TaxID=66431 RepID=A0ABN3WI64_STRTU